MEPIAPILSLKQCGHCGIEKPLSDFWPVSGKKTGRFVWCKDCMKIYRKNRTLFNENKLKKCCRCKTSKPISEFWQDFSRIDRKYPWCIECFKKYYSKDELLKRYGPPHKSFNINVTRLPTEEKGANYFIGRFRLDFIIPEKRNSSLRYRTLFGLGQKKIFVLKTELEKLLTELLGKKEIYCNKLFLDITILKPGIDYLTTHYIALVSYLVQKITGIPDTWYCYNVTWSIDRKQPGVILSLFQEEARHRRICSICGRLLYLEEFGKSCARPLGHEYVCKECNINRQRQITTARWARRRFAIILTGTGKRKKGISSPF